ncbi:multidrug resistance protein, MATE family [Paenibacillus tianmuensis]|uniref:Probable multidrug resistance protein NorM n=1 Tax=Paenibacillus tianmuensis TaxID=624147 RepID=A0A1G4QHK0_9BACL|nr:MATE family efflux transporter [Paenibacillus tianmuensis]SCW44123.1 multidrug resistance protein, MATE family [Paenibacillus tianmuensis]
MKSTHKLSQKIRQLIVILLPILVTQLAMFAMNFFDTFMSGHVSAKDLAGVAIGTSIWIPVQTGLSGILLSVTPMVAQLAGAGRKEEIPFKVVQALYLAVGVAAVVLLAGAFALNPILENMNLEEPVRRIARLFLISIAFGILPMFLYTVLRCFIDALGHTKVTMFISLLSLPVNGVLNYVLIYGKMGLPALGGAGTGVASAISYWVIFLVALAVAARMQPFAAFGIFRKLYRVSLSVWKELLKMGVPIGFAILFETSIFAAVTLLMSNFNTVTIAAHQAAINFASFLYMIPMSIALSLTILVGFEAGAGRYKDARQYGYLGIGLAIGMSLLCAVVLWLFNEQVAGIYTREPDVLALTQHFLVYAIFFQLSDAIAAPIQGALRGYKDVNVTLIVALVSYWIVGLPVGYGLANYTDLGAYGYWIGLISGLALGAVGLFARLASVQRKARLGLAAFAK